LVVDAEESVAAKSSASSAEVASGNMGAEALSDVLRVFEDGLGVLSEF
jgi:hypothetical protein